jgi:hypothetical protein
VVWLAGHAHLSCLYLRQWITIGVNIHSYIQLDRHTAGMLMVRARLRFTASALHAGCTNRPQQALHHFDSVGDRCCVGKVIV